MSGSKASLGKRVVTMPPPTEADMSALCPQERLDLSCYSLPTRLPLGTSKDTSHRSLLHLPPACWAPASHGPPAGRRILNEASVLPSLVSWVHCVWRHSRTVSQVVRQMSLSSPSPYGTRVDPESFLLEVKMAWWYRRVYTPCPALHDGE